MSYVARPDSAASTLQHACIECLASYMERVSSLRDLPEHLTLELFEVRLGAPDSAKEHGARHGGRILCVHGFCVACARRMV